MFADIMDTEGTLIPFTTLSPKSEDTFTQVQGILRCIRVKCGLLRADTDRLLESTQNERMMRARIIKSLIQLPATPVVTINGPVQANDDLV